MTTYSYTGALEGPNDVYLSSYASSEIPFESSVSVYNWGTTTTPLQTVNKTWVSPFALASQTTTIGSISKLVTYTYGPFTEPLETDEYDWGATTPTRKTINRYQSFAPNPSYANYITDKPCKTVVTDGNSNTVSEIDFYYDGGAALCGGVPSPTVTSVSGLVAGTHDETNYGTSSLTPRGNLTEEAHWLNGGTSPSTTYTYDETGQVLSMIAPCGQTGVSCSDISSGSQTTKYFYTDSYSSGTPPGGGVTNAYLTSVTDPLNHITSFTTTGNNCWGEVYNIDPWGNLTGISGVSGMSGCLYENPSIPVNTNNQITGYCYDADGNLLDMGGCGIAVHSYVYDAEGQLESPPIANFTGAFPYSYFYDGDRNRVQKCEATSCVGSSQGMLYWRDPGGTVLDESNRNGTVQEEYVYFNGKRIARRDVVGNTVHYYLSDHLGSASVITDSSGNVQEQTDYYPYGGIAFTSGSDENRYKFTGKERDAESGLDNFGARYNLSSMGRFMTPDPKSLSPVRISDPTTLESVFIHKKQSDGIFGPRRV